MAVLFGAEMPFGVHGLAALGAGGAAAGGDFEAPVDESAHLGTGTPKAGQALGFRVGLAAFGGQFAQFEGHEIVHLVVGEADLPDAEEGFHGGLNAHLLFGVIGGGGGERAALALQLGHKLLDTHREGLDLELLDDEGDGFDTLAGLHVEDALTRGADGVGGDVFNGAEFGEFGISH